jgi:putative flippase GtrA
VVNTAVALLPGPLRIVAVRHREIIKFTLVGGTTWIIDTSVFLLFKSTLLIEKPLTAKAVAVVLATVASYGLNRQWSFRERGGRMRHHEALLYLAVSALAVAAYAAPLALSRYVAGLEVPHVSALTQEVADFVSGQILGVLAGMAFRWWAFRRFVFPDRVASVARPPHDHRVSRRQRPDLSGSVRDRDIGVDGEPSTA